MQEPHGHRLEGAATRDRPDQPRDLDAAVRRLPDAPERLDEPVRRLIEERRD
jgi:hypothetical protein